MRHKVPVLTVKQLLKSVYIYSSYRKNKIGGTFLDHPVYGVIKCIVWTVDHCFPYKFRGIGLPWRSLRQ